jgi:hypothetical protein
LTGSDDGGSPDHGRRLGCSGAARQLGESLAGTAPAGVTRWLLVEHPGPWPLAALTAVTGPAAAVLARAGTLGIRVQLIRRTARRRRRGPHQVYLACTAGPAPWLEGREVADLDQLATLDLDTLAAGRRPGFGQLVTEPLYVVCTNGRRDACCAEFGRPVATAIARGHDVWETTHLGGDRFAANAVCFPDGIYFGRLDPVSGPAVAAAYARGELVLEHYRGRSGVAEELQVAEHHVRSLTGALALTDVAVGSWAVDGVRTSVMVRSGDRSFRVVVETGQAAVPRGLTCRATEVECPPLRRVVGMAELPAGTPPPQPRPLTPLT